MDGSLGEQGDSNNFNYVPVKYKPRKASAIQTFPPLLQSMTMTTDTNKDCVPKALGEPLSAKVLESSNLSSEEGSKEPIATMVLMSQNSLEASGQSGCTNMPAESSQDVSLVAIKIESLEEQTPRRYPACFRVSAVRNFPIGCRQDTTCAMEIEGQKTGISLGNRCAGHDTVLSERAITCYVNENDGTAVSSVHENNEREAERSTRKRRKMKKGNNCNQDDDDNMKIQEDGRGFLVKGDKKEFPIDENAPQLIVEGSNRVDAKNTKIHEHGHGYLFKGDVNESPIDESAPQSIVEGGNDIITWKEVKERLHIFQIIYRKILQEEESKEKKTQGIRIDLMAYSLFKAKWPSLSKGRKLVGSIPGIEVGDEFHMRVEMCAIGLHSQHMAGIDYTKQGERIIAVSIVSAGRYAYADDMGISNELVYSGAGVPDRDQKLERGNLALKNSMEARIPVRVIHGFRRYEGNNSQGLRTGSHTVTTYIYDGLYFVERETYEIGKYNHYVYLFHLKRIPGQPELPIKEIRRAKKGKQHKGLRIEDISQGKEKRPVGVVNTINDELPMPFEYTKKMVYPLQHTFSRATTGCNCVNGCFSNEKCLCAHKNGGEIPFNYSGAIVYAKPLVRECGPSCKCPPSCPNRVSQHGIQFPLQIFMTESRGWGVRSLTSIPSGSFICEYAGELLEEEEAQKRTNDEYLFAIGNNNHDECLWQGLSSFTLEPQKIASGEPVEDVGFTIDASEKGNVGRFINHSCSPNLYAQNVLYDHDDKSMPHVMLFASENIPPLQELTYHYNYAMDQVHDADGNIKRKDCLCGSRGCTGRLY